MRTSILLASQFLLGAHAALVTYNLNLTRGLHNADGQNKVATWLINGHHPGPTIVATKGDTLEVTVRNGGDEGVTIHWHGIEQEGTPWSDGVPALTQYPIEPNEDFVYRFEVTQTGGYWYHSHMTHQLADGLFGAMHLLPNANTTSSINAISGLPNKSKALAAEKKAFPLVLADNTHFGSHYMTAEWDRTQIEQLCLDNILINGKGQVVCPNLATLQPKVPPVLGNITARGCTPPSSGIVDPYGKNFSSVDPAIWSTCTPTNTPLEVFQVNATDKYAVFNVVNAGQLWDLKVSIDSHPFYVLSADGNYVQPILTNTVVLAIGERHTLLVPLTQTPGDYTIRVATSVLLQYLTQNAVLRYKRSSAPALPITTAPAAVNPYMDADGFATAAADVLEHHELHPFPSTLVPPQGPADYTLRLVLTRSSSQSWALNGVNMVPVPSVEPLLYNQTNVNTLSNVSYAIVPVNSIVDVIVEINVLATGGGHPSHPMHKHNVHAYYVGQGTGEFPAATVWDAKLANTTGINFVNPPLRDTFATISTPTGKSWAAFRWVSQIAMPTLIHCHLEPHISTGMQFVIMEALETLQPIPSYYCNRRPDMC